MAEALPSDSKETPDGKKSGYLDVFVVRSFRESHLEKVVEIIRDVVESYRTPDQRAEPPFRLIDTDRDIAAGAFLLGEISTKIEGAALTIVVLDGMRLNVLFELGLLYGIKKPFVILRHKRWGPSFSEIELLMSDLKGVVIKDYDHEGKDDSFRDLLRGELARCEQEFVSHLGGHLVVADGVQNLLTHDSWTFGNPADGTKTPTEIILRSFEHVDLSIERHISVNSQFIVRFDLMKADATITAYLHARFAKDGKEVGVWFGYASDTLVGRRDLGREITIPLRVSGPGKYMLVDNIVRMAKQRLGVERLPGLIIDKVRLRGHNGSEVHITDVKITE
jgi:hypothetical protein